jgi:hypothetical protein
MILMRPIWSAGNAGLGAVNGASHHQAEPVGLSGDPPPPNGGRPMPMYGRESNGRAGEGTSGPMGRFGRVAKAAPPILRPDLSAVQRDRLLIEMESIKAIDDAATWAQLSLPAKNTLTTEDAQIIEARFAAKLAALEMGATEAQPYRRRKQKQQDESLATSREAEPVRRRRVAAKTIRLRDKEHRRLVATLPCLVCGRTPADPHHLRYAQPRALGRKVSDEFTVPVCRLHHGELHRVGDEAAWWTKAGIDPLPVALELWRQSREGGELEAQRNVNSGRPAVEEHASLAIEVRGASIPTIEAAAGLESHTPTDV